MSRNEQPKWTERPGTIVKLSLPCIDEPNTYAKQVRVAVELGRLCRQGVLPVDMIDNPGWCWMYLGEFILPEEDHCWLSNLGDKVGRFLGPDGVIRSLRVSWFCEAGKSAEGFDE